MNMCECVACGGYKQQFHSFQITDVPLSGAHLKLVCLEMCAASIVITVTVAIAIAMADAFAVNSIPNEIFQNILRIWGYAIVRYKTKDIIFGIELLMLDENRVSHSLCFCVPQSHSMMTHTRCVRRVPMLYIAYSFVPFYGVRLWWWIDFLHDCIEHAISQIHI